MRYGKTTSIVATMSLLLAACATSGDDAVVADEVAAIVVESTGSTHTPPTETSAPSIDQTTEQDATLTYPIVSTGQSACYSDTGQVVACPAEGEEFFGQDGNYLGTEAAYSDGGDGTVTDLVTGLVWQQDPGEKMTYREAVSWVETLDLAGYDDWRLPTIKELYSLIDFSGTDPSGCETVADCDAVPFIDTAFFAFEYGDTTAGERVIDAQYLSSTLYVDTTMNGDETVFGVNFADGRIKGYPIDDPRGGEKVYFVIAVRGSEAYGENRLVDNGDGTVDDLATGLVWQQSDDGVARDWSEALGYCETLDLAGSDDWRLPAAKELQSIVDYTRSPDATGSAAIDPVFSASVIIDEAGAENYGFYWSSTTHAALRGGIDAVYVVFGDGLGWMQSPQGDSQLLDVHGAGSQRSDPKQGDSSDYPAGRGPQGDVIRIANLVRCVGGGAIEVTSGGFEAIAPSLEGVSSEEAPSEVGTGGPLADAAAILGVSEQVLVDALGPPAQREPDLAAAAAILGVTEAELRAALPPPG